MSSLGIDMQEKKYIIHPLRFALWLFLITIIMIFGSLTSAYVVNKSFLLQPQVFDLPSILWNNTLLILFSSVSMQYAVWASKNGTRQNVLIALAITMILGIAFLVGQFEAWKDMVASGLPMVADYSDPGNSGHSDNSVSFFYIFTGLHGLHIIGGLIVLMVSIYKTSAARFTQAQLKLNYELTATFWHFLGGLWLYLFIFLKYAQQ